MCDPRSTPNNALPLRRLSQSNSRIICGIGEGPAADLHRKPVTKVSPTLRHGQRVPGVATPVPLSALRSVRTAAAARRMRTRGPGSRIRPPSAPFQRGAALGGVGALSVPGEPPAPAEGAAAAPGTAEWGASGAPGAAVAPGTAASPDARHF